MCHGKCIGVTGTNIASLECLHTQSGNRKARQHPLKDEKVANLRLLKRSFWFLLITFLLKKKRHCRFWSLLPWKGFGAKDLIRYKTPVSKYHPISPITVFI